jgi:hypothetical protein
MGPIIVKLPGSTATVNFDSEIKYVMLDTAASVSYLSLEDAADLNSKLGLTYNTEVSNAAGGTIYSVDCDSVDSLPTLTFTFDGQLISISPIDYIIVSTYNNAPFCFSAFWGQQQEANKGLLLGNSILRSWYTIFDKSGDGVIGIVKAVRIDVVGDQSFEVVVPPITAVTEPIKTEESSSQSTQVALFGAVVAMLLA